MLVAFQGHTFLHEGRWFIWDTGMELFRPIDNFAWDGSAWVIDDHIYRKDPLEKSYGFGSVEMLLKCVRLGEIYGQKINTAPAASYLAIGSPVWFRDRPINFTHKASRDVSSWKRLIKGHARTCKKRSSNKFTKRNL
jgi:hypothetical protein